VPGRSGPFSVVEAAQRGGWIRRSSAWSSSDSFGLRISASVESWMAATALSADVSSHVCRARAALSL